MTLQAAPIAHRYELALLLNWGGLLGEVVEVGTHRGAFARGFLARWKGKVYHGIDPWATPPGYEEQAFLPEMGPTREHDYEYATGLIRMFPNRVKLHRGLSVDVAKSFADNSLDMVYIDGDHSYEGVLTDLKTWWPKVKPGGYIAGHDYIMPHEPNWKWAPQIQRAVAEFLNGSHVYLIPERNGPWSFYAGKPSS